MWLDFTLNNTTFMHPPVPGLFHPRAEQSREGRTLDSQSNGDARLKPPSRPAADGLLNVLTSTVENPPPPPPKQNLLAEPNPLHATLVPSGKASEAVFRQAQPMAAMVSKRRSHSPSFLQES
ncbi:unnamed protein product [Boreogadus saida]